MGICGDVFSGGWAMDRFRQENTVTHKISRFSVQGLSGRSEPAVLIRNSRRLGPAPSPAARRRPRAVTLWQEITLWGIPVKFPNEINPGFFSDYSWEFYPRNPG